MSDRSYIKCLVRPIIIAAMFWSPALAHAQVLISHSEDGSIRMGVKGERLASFLQEIKTRYHTNVICPEAFIKAKLSDQNVTATSAFEAVASILSDFNNAVVGNPDGSPMNITIFSEGDAPPPPEIKVAHGDAMPESAASSAPASAVAVPRKHTVLTRQQKVMRQWHMQRMPNQRYRSRPHQFMRQPNMQRTQNQRHISRPHQFR